MEEEKKEPFDSKSVIINKVERGNFFKYTTIALLVVLIAGLAYVVYGDKFSFGEDIAAKVNGVWKLVWDGNGIPDCVRVNLYPKFPNKMIPQCFNAATGEIIVR